MMGAGEIAALVGVGVAVLTGGMSALTFIAVKLVKLGAMAESHAIMVGKIDKLEDDVMLILDRQKRIIREAPTDYWESVQRKEEE
jgi:hypothetical protein